MAFFTVETFGYSNPEFKQNLQACLAKLPLDLKTALELAARSDTCWNIQYYPSAWADSSRIGASALRLPETQLKRNKLQFAEDANVKFAPHDILAQLKIAAKSYRFTFFDKVKKAEKQSIKHAITELEEALVTEKLNFLHYAMQATANQLRSHIQQYKLTQELSKLHADLNIFNQLLDDAGKCKLITANASLNFTKEAHVLAKALRKNANKFQVDSNANQSRKITSPDFLDETIEDTVLRQAEQLSILAKRFGDFFYDNPREKTRAERARRAMRIAVGVFTGLCALAAIISYFVAPYLSPLFLLGCSAGYYLIADDLFEIGRHLWHGRTPTKVQLFKYAIRLPLVITYISLVQLVRALPLLAEMANFCKDYAYKLQGFIELGHALVQKHMPYLSGLSNFRETLVDAPVLQTIAGPAGVAISYKSILQRMSTDVMPGYLALDDEAAIKERTENQAAEQTDVQAQARVLIEKFKESGEADLEKFAKNYGAQLMLLIQATAGTAICADLESISKKIAKLIAEPVAPNDEPTSNIRQRIG